MSQQQLLLLVLATLIVGLATIAGIAAFDQGSKRANQDALTKLAVEIASDAQVHLQKPTQLGGAGIGDVKDIGSNTDLPTLSGLGYSTKSASDHGLSTPVYESAHGECSLSTDTSDPYVTINCESTKSAVTVKVRSTNAEGIETAMQSVKD